MTPAELSERIKKIRLVIFDVDGVLTDGRIVYDSRGTDLKFFDVADGLGMALLDKAGIDTVMMTAKGSRVVSRRAKDFNIKAVYQDCRDKLATFEKIQARFKIKPEEVCFVGDDLVDLPVLKRVGFAVSVPNAVDEAREVSHYITKKPGGRGAVREICDMILKTQGKWEEVIARYNR